MFDFPERALSFESKFGYAVGYLAAYVYYLLFDPLFIVCIAMAAMAGYAAYSARRDTVKPSPHRLAGWIFGSFGVIFGLAVIIPLIPR